LKTTLLKLLFRALSLLPLKVTRKVGLGIASFFSLFLSRMGRITDINLAHCFPELDEEERQHIAKTSLQETFITAFEMGPIWFWPIEKVYQSVHEVVGLQILLEAYAEQRGVIVIIPHLGNWEVMGLYLNNCNCGQVSVMYQAPDSPELDKLIYSARSRGGIDLAATNNKGVAKALSKLRNGGVLGILPDQVPPRSGGDYAHFFGKEALTMSLLPRLLKKTGAKAILAYAQRRNGSRGAGFKIVFKIVNEEIYAEHMPSAMQAMNDAIEDAVRVVPEQYQWEYKRFKRQREGSPNIY
jgi:Kdo2-lipid IVA lauroyltransferase/acyltransferase